MSLYFLFVQFEFTHAIGPHAARYIVDAAGGERGSGGATRTAIETRNEDVAGVRRGIGAADVLVVGVVQAPASLPRLRRKARPVDAPASPAQVPLSLVTFVKGTVPIGEKSEAARRLDAIRVSEDLQEGCVTEALEVLNLAIRAYRAGAHDPYATEVTRRDARSVRIGYGLTEDVQEGRWESAVELAPPSGRRVKRIERLRPAEAVAAVLSGRTTVLEGEDLLARTLIDLDNHRTRAAAFQLGAALELLPIELSDPWLGAADLESLAGLATQAQELLAAAGRRALDEDEVARVESIVDQVQAALEAWRYERAQ